MDKKKGRHQKKRVNGQKKRFKLYLQHKYKVT